MNTVKVLGIDIASNVFQLHGTDERGNALLKKRLRRLEFAPFIANLPPCLIAMEACSGSHHWARKFRTFGHEVKLISPQFVKPYVKSNKNDAMDAEAIAEAVTRPTMRFVPTKEIWHQDVQSLHRARQQMMHNRIALNNQIRGLLREYGIVVPMGIPQLKKELPSIVEDATHELSGMTRDLFCNLHDELKSIEKRIAVYDQKILNIFRNNETCQRISKIEGVGTLTATAAVSCRRSQERGQK